MALHTDVLEVVAFRALLEEYPRAHKEIRGSDKVVSYEDGEAVLKDAEMDPVLARAIAKAIAQVVPYVVEHATVSTTVLTSPVSGVDEHTGKGLGTIS